MNLNERPNFPDLDALRVRLRGAELEAQRLGLGFTAFLIGVAAESITGEAAERREAVASGEIVPRVAPFQVPVKAATG